MLIRLLLLLLTIALAAPVVRGEKARRPNVIIFLADDLGYADVGYHGCPIPTPNIDAIAKGGVRFTQAYVTAPVCSPTRAGLITGRYQQRFGHEMNTGGIRKDLTKVGLPTSERTLADVLRPAGYATGIVGKWHLGLADRFHPLARGFDEFYGFLGGARTYEADDLAYVAPLLRGRRVLTEHGYLTDEFGREAAAFVERHHERPFFLFLSFSAVHAPLEARDDDLARFAHIRDIRRRKLAAMLHSMDRAMGRVLGVVREHGLERDTLVAFLSDNGGIPIVSGNAPLQGGKGHLTEGGIRVPLAIRWPARIPAGKVYDRPVISLDLFATAVAAAGVTLPKGLILDGVDLLPHVLGESERSPHETLHWRWGGRWAIRHGDWKLVRRRGKPRLHDLARDPGEATDLATKHPEKVRTLEALHDGWSRRMVKPAWGRANRPGMPGVRNMDAWFRRVDTDGDGRASMAETGFDDSFGKFDRDRDGYVTREEAEAFIGKR